MRRFYISDIAVMALAWSLTMAAPVQAQMRPGVGFVQQATPDADELAGQMRLLAANPSDVSAMVRAGELTLKLGDATAAAGFFARAERIDPSNPRIKAGKGSLLVQSGRPGEALLQFGQAEQLRGDVRRFAADRGLAYDLLGEQERAQRDYRLALRDGPADETVRRYALSLGISGKRDEALAQIDSLLRRSDRAAWRTRAFILAMTGDSGGATRIATSMMPRGMAQGLQPFFDRLQRLGPVDRAFAVHFGEVRPSLQRVADARLAPRLPALAPEPGRPAQVVAVAAVQPAKADRKKDRKRGKRDRIEVASVPPPVPLPQPPAYQGVAVATLGAVPNSVYVQQIPRVRAATPRSISTLPPVVLASSAAPQMTMLAMPFPTRGVVSSPGRPAPETNTRIVAEPASRRLSEVPIRSVAPTAVASAIVTPRAVVVEPAERSRQVAVEAGPAARVAAASIVTQPLLRAAPVSAVPPQAVAVPVAPNDNVAAARSAAVVEAGDMTVVPVTAISSAAAIPPTSTAPLVASSATLPPAPGPVRGEDSILAKIIANITVPGSELEVAPVEPAPVPIRTATAPPPRAFASAATRAAPGGDTGQLARAAQQSAEARIADKTVADRKLAAKKLADKKTADAKKAADAKKLADAKKAEELKKNDPKLIEPSRIWVQVAGGANEANLGKEWARIRDKAPKAFKGRAGWTTPLRLTNRVLTGPFKTDAEARAFVNMLTKEGLSGFPFKSDAGQKVTRLAGK